ncbi:hypothetical protein MRB53_012280 [Persea americana]|uniref:Uncharacterized protein n=1 Tax=Persea americana TaxID=3435 RepID=A0ACC2LXS4_PERAE|nr:hypothetical protein MRB53_012280 [Persea americana]
MCEVVLLVACASLFSEPGDPLDEPTNLVVGPCKRQLALPDELSMLRIAILSPIRPSILGSGSETKSGQRPILESAQQQGQASPHSEGIRSYLWLSQDLGLGPTVPGLA